MTNLYYPQALEFAGGPNIWSAQTLSETFEERNHRANSISFLYLFCDSKIEKTGGFSFKQNTGLDWTVMDCRWKDVSEENEFTFA
jgi:hypothetical protein